LLILLALAAFAVLLVPVYYRNYQFQQSLKQVAASAASGSDDALRAVVMERASRLGLPVRGDDVLLDRSGARLRIEVKYRVSVDLSVYSVSLHFHPSSE
jgi:hypothetical protein